MLVCILFIESFIQIFSLYLWIFLQLFRAAKLYISYIPTYKLLLLFKRKSQKRVKEIFWHPCDDSAAIMFNEGHDLIFVEKKKKTSLAQKIYI